MLETRGYYRHSCINCGGETSDARLSLGIPCSKCYPIHVEDLKNEKLTVEEIYKVLKSFGTIKNYNRIYKLHREFKRVEDLVEKVLKSKLWSAQKTWTIRVLRRESFAIVAPTGVGKTLFGIVMALHFAREKKKSYIVLPTTPLVIQVVNKLIDFNEKLGAKVKILYYHAKMKSKEKSKALEAIKRGEYDILVSTSKFLTIHFKALEKEKFYFIFVDDVDSILKSSKNIDKLLILLGYSIEDVEKAYQLVKLKNTILKTLKKKGEVKNLIKDYEDLKRSILKISKKKHGILVVSTATGRPRGLRVKLFRELLGFEIGSKSETLRNIVDVYVESRGDVKREVVKLVKKLGRGGLVYVPLDLGVEYAEEVVRELIKNNVKADVLTSGKFESLEKFVKGELEVLVGVATYYGIMVRGLDLPETVRYAVFAGVPKFKFSAKFEDPHPLNILRALSTIREALKGEELEKAERYILFLRRTLEVTPLHVLEEVKKKLVENLPLKSTLEQVCKEALQLVKSFLSREDVVEALKKIPGVSVTKEGDTLYLMIPDVTTYIQASGRTSRLYVGGITRGLSIVIYEDKKLIEGLILRSKWALEDIEWKDLKDVDLERIMREIDADREEVRKARSGELALKVKDPIKSALLIVESPTKARTIANFFGKPSIRRVGPIRVYECTTGDLVLNIVATKGHIYDLVTDTGIHGVLVPEEYPVNRHIPVYTSIKRCLTCGYQFSDDLEECPKCKSSNLKSQLETIEALKNIAIEVDSVLIGTDPDVEGEKIGWDIAVSLRPFTKSVKRVEFHEVTKRAILNALKFPRDVNVRLVEAQIVRRVEDRWVGFELSQRLWRAFGKKWLSAGRVQTPVLGWIVKRYKDWKEEVKPVYILKLPYNLTVEIPEEVIGGELEISKLKFEIEPLEEVIEDVKPQPPYTTDKLIEDATEKLKIGALKVMQLAQELFETGLITYHRTDSTRVSQVGIEVARTYLREVLGREADSYFYPRSWGEGGAHECIRPTRPLDSKRLREAVIEGRITAVKPLTRLHYALYDIIFKRFIASQMTPAKSRIQRVQVKSLNLGLTWTFRRITSLEGGFSIVYKPFKLEEPVKSKVKTKPLDVIRVRKSKISLFTQGDIIRLMREKGIGRPSTYAKIIQTLLRKYVIESRKTRRLIPTSLGIKTYNYLVTNYNDLVSESRTAYLEALMDEVAEGRRGYEEVIEMLHKEIASLN